VSVVEHSAGGGGLVDRAKLAAAGAKYYNGSKCGRCSSTLRYALTRACVTCTRRKAQARTSAKKEAKRAAGLEACKRLGLI
jgi:hypothetical protein